MHLQEKALAYDRFFLYSKTQGDCMRKYFCILIFFLIYLLVACDTNTTTINSTTNDSSNLTSTTIPEPFVHPFPEWTFMRHIDFSDTTFLTKLAITNRLVYLDHEMLVSSQLQMGGTTETSIIAFGKTTSIQISSSTAEPFIFHYDATNEALYYEDIGSNRIAPNTTNFAIDQYGLRTSKIQHSNSLYTVFNKKIITFRGELLFSTEDNLIYPTPRIGDPIRFYTYHPQPILAQGCQIFTHSDFSSDPVLSWSHSQYTCSEEVIERSGVIAIRLLEKGSSRGFVIMDKEGVFREFIFQEKIDDFGSYSLQSFKIVSPHVLFFEYRDTLGTTHSVAMNPSLSDILTDEFLSSLHAQRITYWDDEYRFVWDFDSQYRLYKKGSLFYTYQPMFSEFDFTRFARFGEVGVIYNSSMQVPGGKLTRLHLDDKTTKTYDYTSFSPLGKIINRFLLETEEGYLFYDAIDDQFEPAFGISGQIRSISDSILLLTTESNVWIVDLLNDRIIETVLITFLSRNQQSPYAFFVEYQGRYYWIG